MTQHSVEPLAWDTEFFGFPIGRVDLAGATEESLRAIDADARAQGIECFYGTLDPTEARRRICVQRFGHRLVEVAIKFGRPAIPFTPKPTAAKVRRGTVDDLPLLARGDRHARSRGAASPTIPGSGTPRRVACTRRGSSVPPRTVTSTCCSSPKTTTASWVSRPHVRTPVPRVDLMGVTSQGSGAAWALMAGLVEWAGGGPIEAGPCAARNLAPLRFLEHCGFDIRETAVHLPPLARRGRGNRHVSVELDGSTNAERKGSSGGNGPERIPFNRPSIEGNEIELIRSAVELGHTVVLGTAQRRRGGAAARCHRRAATCCSPRRAQRRSR